SRIVRVNCNVKAGVSPASHIHQYRFESDIRSSRHASLYEKELIFAPTSPKNVTLNYTVSFWNLPQCTILRSFAAVEFHPALAHILSAATHKTRQTSGEKSP
ncbi:MAG: hypothetical protein ACK5U4_13595, partial [Rhodospirillales bacterium]